MPLQPFTPSNPPTAQLAPRVVLGVTVAVFAGFITNVIQHVSLEGDPARVVLALALASGVVALHIGVLGNPRVEASSTRARLAATGLAVICVAGVTIFGDPWDSMTAMLTAAAFFVLPWVFGVLSILVAATVIALLTPEDPWMFVYVLVFQTIFGVGFFVLGRLRGVVLELDAARDSLQIAALRHERLRLAQDLHDLFGLALSAIVLKAELAKRLISRQPERARQELRELGDLADHTHRDLLTVASRSARPEIDDELATAAVVLADAGATLRVHGHPGRLSGAAAETFALVIREGTANIVRHSRATAVVITWSRDASGVTLTVHNDGARIENRTTSGQGHRNLHDRVHKRGGTFSATATGSAGSGSPPSTTSFDLVARLPHRQSSNLLADTSGRRFLSIAALVFAAEAAHTIFLVAGRSHPPWVLLVAGGAATVATVLLALELTARPARHRGRRAAIFATIAILTFTPMLVFGDPFLGAPGVAAAAALTLLGPSVRVITFAVILFGMPLLHAMTGSESFYVLWSAEVVIDHGLILFAILQLLTMARQLRATRTRLSELAVDDARVRFETELDAVLRPGLVEIARRAASAEHDVISDSIRAATTVETLVIEARELVGEVRRVASTHTAAEDIPDPTAFGL